MKLKFLRVFVPIATLSILVGCKNRTDTAGSKSAEGATCVDRVISVLRIDMEAKTDPAIIEDILQKDMLLGDLPSVRELFSDELDHAVQLGPMLRNIKDGIELKQPAINEFLCVAMGQGLISLKDDSEIAIITRTLHHTYLLNGLVHKMGDSLPFMSDVKQHLQKKREELGIKPGFIESTVEIFQLTGDLFSPAKAKTIDIVMDDYVQIRHRGSVVDSDIRNRKVSLILNIMEASITDRVHGFKDNAIAGVGLAINPLKGFSMTPETSRLEYDVSPEWARLYQTWNFAFITGNLPNLHLLYPKLLIPLVMGTDNKDYLYNRTVALWASINFHLFAKLNHRESTPMRNRKELAMAWGQINLRHAERYVSQANDGRKLTGFRDLRYIPLDGLKSTISKALVRLGVSE